MGDDRQPHAFPARTRERARYWHDYRWPGDVARAIVVAQRDHRRLPVAMPEQCRNPACVVCHADELSR